MFDLLRGLWILLGGGDSPMDPDPPPPPPGGDGDERVKTPIGG